MIFSVREEVAFFQHPKRRESPLLISHIGFDKKLKI